MEKITVADDVSRPVLTDSRNTLLWIDDYEPALAMYRTVFESRGFRVLTASRPSQGLQLALAHPIDLVICDYEMPEMNGEEVIAALKAWDPRLPVVVFSASHVLSERTRRLADACCDKARPVQSLMAVIQRLIVAKTVKSAGPLFVRPSSEKRQRTAA
jgi:formate transporter